MSSVSQLRQKLCTFSKTPCAIKTRFFDKFGCNKAVKFGRSAYLHWDYNLTKNHSILRGSGGNVPFLC
jgi:predicted glycosyltransferase